MRRVTIWVDGHVQGVGFRWWVWDQARRLGIAGRARNLFDGRVEIDAQGADADVAALIEVVTGRRPVVRRPGHVSGWLVEEAVPDPTLTDFDIR